MFGWFQTSKTGSQLYSDTLRFTDFVVIMVSIVFAEKTSKSYGVSLNKTYFVQKWLI